MGECHSPTSRMLFLAGTYYSDELLVTSKFSEPSLEEDVLRCSRALIVERSQNRRSALSRAMVLPYHSQVRD